MLDPVVENLSNIPNSSLGKLEITPLDDSEPQQQQPPTNESPFASSPFGSSKVVRKRKTSLGKIVSVKDNLGLVMFAVSDVEKCQIYKLELPSFEGGTQFIGVKVGIPDWWPVN